MYVNLTNLEEIFYYWKGIIDNLTIYLRLKKDLDKDIFNLYNCFSMDKNKIGVDGYIVFLFMLILIWMIV